jgi:hypothetical protein
MAFIVYDTKSVVFFWLEGCLVLDCLSRSQKLTESSMTRQMDFCDPLNN